MLRKLSRGAQPPTIKWFRLVAIRTLRRALSSKLLRASVVVAFASCVAIWVSNSTPKDKKELAKVLFDNAEPIAISSAAAVFLLEIPDRQKTDQYEAWQVLNSALGQPGSGGRIQALEDLNRDRVDLEGVAAPQADLSGINLYYGKLRRVDFEHTQLDGANLEGADLCGANLEGADLCGANLRGTHLRSANLEGANLRSANLEGANLRSANLEGAHLGDANLKGAHLGNANLKGANLRFAKLRGAGLGQVKLERANLSFANLKGANLSFANLEEADLRSTNLEGAILLNTNLKGMKNLDQDELTQAKLCCTCLSNEITLNPNRDCKELGFNLETGEFSAEILHIPWK